MAGIPRCALASLQPNFHFLVHGPFVSVFQIFVFNVVVNMKAQGRSDFLATYKSCFHIASVHVEHLLLEKDWFDVFDGQLLGTKVHSDSHENHLKEKMTVPGGLSNCVSSCVLTLCATEVNSDCGFYNDWKCSGVAIYTYRCTGNQLFGRAFQGRLFNCLCRSRMRIDYHRNVVAPL